MKISQLAKETGISSKTIRYYETIGLLPQPLRQENGYRNYTDSDVQRLIFIRRCRDLLIPLAQIRQLVVVQMDKTASCREVERIVDAQLEKVHKTQAELALLERSLSSLASCQKEQVRECEILHRLNTLRPEDDRGPMTS